MIRMIETGFKLPSLYPNKHCVMPFPTCRLHSLSFQTCRLQLPKKRPCFTSSKCGLNRHIRDSIILCEVAQYHVSTLMNTVSKSHEKSLSFWGRTYQLYLCSDLGIFLRLLEFLKNSVILQSLVWVLTVETAKVVARDDINEFMPHITSHFVVFIQYRVIRLARVDSHQAVEETVDIGQSTCQAESAAVNVGSASFTHPKR